MLVAGFQGVSISRDVDARPRRIGHDGGRGRGGDRCRVCEIYTDVAGVFSADPRIVPDARKLPQVSFEEMLEMAASGAKVLQLRSVEYARTHGVRLHCRSSFDDGPGTVVLGEDETMEHPLITAVTHSTDEARITLIGVPDRPGAAASIFTALAEANCNVDTIIQNEPLDEGRDAEVSFTIGTEDLRAAQEAQIPSSATSPSPASTPIARSARSRSSAPGCARTGRRRQGVPDPGRGGHQHRDDLDLADQDLVRDPLRRSPPAVRALHSAFEGSSAPAASRPSAPSRIRKGAI